MNRSTCLMMMLLLFAVACRKSANKDIGPVMLTGKWTFTENFYSTGGLGEWHPAQPANQVIEFKPDGSFSGAANFLSGATSYEIVDSAKVRFGPASLPAGFRLMIYDLKSAPGTLVLYPADPICIEGCSYKFRR